MKPHLTSLLVRAATVLLDAASRVEGNGHTYIVGRKECDIARLRGTFQAGVALGQQLPRSPFRPVAAAVGEA